MKKNKYNIILLILITLIVLYFSLKDNLYEVLLSITKLNPFWIIIALIFELGYYYFKSLSLYSFTKKIKKNIQFKKTLKISLITHFFDGITPSSTGGQPYQIYALKKEKINLTDSTNIIIQNFIVYQIALIFLGIYAVIFNKQLNLFENVGIKKLIILGFIINVIVMIALFCLAFIKKINEFILKILIKLLIKLKIVKNKEEIINNLNKYIDNFHNGALVLLKDKKNFLKNILYNIIALTLQYSIPLIILYGLKDYNSINIIKTLIASTYVMLIGSFVPIPGGTGGLEYAFTQFYGVFITGPQLSVVMLLWRFFTYYLGIIIGAVLINIRKKR